MRFNAGAVAIHLKYIIMIDVTHIHPMLVHFPIALVMIGLLFEAMELFFLKEKKLCSCGEYILYFATISALASIISGVLFTDNFVGKPSEVKEIHELMAILSTILLCLTSFIYLIRRFKQIESNRLHMTGFTFYLLSAVLIAVTGYFGGNLVYTYMIGL